MAQFITAKEAAQLIPDGATVAISGMGLSGWAEALGCAVRDRFKETGHPRDLHLKQDSAMGDWAVGQKFIGWDRNKREVPDTEHGARGSTRFGEAGPGLITKTGLGTFVDPRVEGGRMNEAAKDEIVKLIEFNGEEYLFAPS